MFKIKDLVVNYGYVNVLKGINLNIEEGQIVSILGANGAGKTTTLKAISSLVPIVSGEIEFNGQRINGISADKIVSSGIVHCPEGRKIFPQLSVEENLKIGSYTRKDKLEIKKDFDRVYNYFPRLKERKKQLAGTLSGGEQQMLAIGRGLMGKPKLFIMDEPSLGLAPIVVKEIFEIIKEINKEGVTVLLVEQNAFQTIKISDYVYILETGNISIHGKATELSKNEDIKKSYLGG